MIVRKVLLQLNSKTCRSSAAQKKEFFCLLNAMDQMAVENSYGFVNGCCYQIKLLVKQHFELINYGNVCVKRVYKKARSPISWSSLPVRYYCSSSCQYPGFCFSLVFLLSSCMGMGKMV